MIDLTKINSIYFVGIGGVSMSALAKLMLSEGKFVSGCDDNLNYFTKKLCSLGAVIQENQYPSEVENCNLVVYTTAVPKKHPDLVLAKKLKKTILERAEFLALISKEYKNVIAISGTHGKTTTTAMIASIMENKKPTTHIGGDFSEISGNIKIGKKNFFITEACEFNKSFLHLSPNISVVTNIECDHMDCYENFEDLKNAFMCFISKTTDFVVLNYNILHFCDKFFAKQKVLTFDIGKKCDFWADELKEENGCFSFIAYNDNFKLGEIHLAVQGKHNVLNALASIAVGIRLGIPFSEIQNKLTNFKGVHRRFEILYKKELTVIQDYAHHPTEISCAINTAKLLHPKKLVCVFQPHTYSRTKTLFNDFLTCFNGCDELILIPTYKAREKETDGYTSFDLFKNLSDDLNSLYFENINDLKNYLFKTKINDEIILWIGAGNINEYAQNFVKKLKK